MKSTRADREVVRITDARGSLSDDIAGRRKRYLISMTIRVVCFVSAYFAHGALRWVAVAGAVFIPYFAVVIANAGRNLRAAPPLPPVTPLSRQLDGRPTARDPRADRVSDDGPDGADVDSPGEDPAADRAGRQDEGIDREPQWASHTSGSFVHDSTSSGS